MRRIARRSRRRRGRWRALAPSGQCSRAMATGRRWAWRTGGHGEGGVEPEVDARSSPHVQPTQFREHEVRVRAKVNTRFCDVGVAGRVVVVAFSGRGLEKTPIRSRRRCGGRQAGRSSVLLPRRRPPPSFMWPFSVSTSGGADVGCWSSWPWLHMPRTPSSDPASASQGAGNLTLHLQRRAKPRRCHSVRSAARIDERCGRRRTSTVVPRSRPATVCSRHVRTMRRPTTRAGTSQTSEARTSTWWAWRARAAPTTSCGRTTPSIGRSSESTALTGCAGSRCPSSLATPRTGGPTDAARICTRTPITRASSRARCSRRARPARSCKGPWATATCSQQCGPWVSNAGPLAADAALLPGCLLFCH